mmetsp:Transcript_631/g.1094  ORF Transcript_631/g.1094 Transcript_631/m.1094 type:complete len:89 (-) Transcript_631:400-666(-)
MLRLKEYLSIATLNRFDIISVSFPFLDLSLFTVTLREVLPTVEEELTLPKVDPLTNNIESSLRVERGPLLTFRFPFSILKATESSSSS